MWIKFKKLWNRFWGIRKTWYSCKTGMPVELTESPTIESFRRMLETLDSWECSIAYDPEAMGEVNWKEEGF